MVILHYTIGLPPTRHGGSVQVANDLMHEQTRQGHIVLALICGDTLIRETKARIKHQETKQGINVYVLSNPLTPTLIYGVSDPDAQHRSIRIDHRNFKSFIESNRIEVLHLHTLMGIHSDIIRIFKECGVKIIYTTHDFHGICPHYNLIDQNGHLCDGISNGERCARCNTHEPSDLFLRLANSKLYHTLKRYTSTNSIKKVKPIASKVEKEIVENIPTTKKDAFKRLLDYYRDYFLLIDVFHFNSTQTKEKFEKVLGPLTGKVVPVTTSGVQDKRQKLNLSDKLIFGFVGSLNDYKGFPILKEVVTELIADGHSNFQIKVYGSNLRGIDSECAVIEYCDPYTRTELSKVFYNLDCMIVPSKWYETFSLVTIEAYAHGRPVIVSDHVGAKDIVRLISSDMIFSSKEELKKIIKRCIIDPNYLTTVNKKILSIPWTYNIEDNCKEILELYI